MILIDAGSTGSRIHVHTYSVSSSSPLPDIQPSHNKKLKPGLSSYALNPLRAAVSATELITFAKEQVPPHLWSITPIHLQATAGLRSITPNQAKAVLDVVRDTLAASGFRFERGDGNDLENTSWARVISGEQEGINGWLAANYLAKVFHQSPTADQGINTLGVVEMGGTSLQLTYVPSAAVMQSFVSSSSSSLPLYPLHIAGHSFTVYTHSYLRYGLQAAERLFQQTLMDRIEQFGNPCFPRGSYRHSAIGDYSKCTDWIKHIMDKQTCRWKSPSASSSSLSSSSSSDASQEASQAEDSEAAPTPAAGLCSFNDVFQPNLADEKSSFIAIENFYYTLQFFGVHEQAGASLPLSLHNTLDSAPPSSSSSSSSSTADTSANQEARQQVEQQAAPAAAGRNNLLPLLDDRGAAFCSSEFASLTSQHPGVQQNELANYCFAAAYERMMLTYGLGFTPQNNLKAVREINKNPIDWALGAVLAEILRMRGAFSIESLPSSSLSLSSSSSSSSTPSSSSSEVLSSPGMLSFGMPVWYPWQGPMLIVLVIGVAVFVARRRKQQLIQQANNTLMSGRSGATAPRYNNNIFSFSIDKP